jgi:hypothetical protein
MDPSDHTMSAIFVSVIEPLTVFERLAEEFVDRKDIASKRYESMIARRRTQNIPVKESKDIESAWSQVQTEERSSFAPRLEYLAELYHRRSGELMQRSQLLAEQRLALGEAALHAAPAQKASAQEAADRARKAQDKEMEEFQQLCKDNQRLLQIVQKYNLKGAEGGGLARTIQTQQIQQRKLQQQQQQQEQQANAKNA